MVSVIFLTRAAASDDETTFTFTEVWIDALFTLVAVTVVSPLLSAVIVAPPSFETTFTLPLSVVQFRLLSMLSEG